MTFPIRDVKFPNCLLGQHNGRLPDTLLDTVPGQDGGPPVRLVEPAARAWKALCAAALDAGHVLKATSVSDSFRPYAVQERIFRQRYTTTPLRGRPSRLWDGVRWYQKPGTAAAAVPGTSNHGWALAVDTGVELDGDAGTESIDQATLAWLVRNEERFGFSHELQSEPWHIRYFAGDVIPAAVLAHEQEDDDMTPEQAKQLAETRLVVADLQARLADIGDAVAGWAQEADGSRSKTKRSLIGRIGDAVKAAR